MKKRLFSVSGLLVILLAVGLVFVGCASAPSSFSTGSGGETTVLLRQDLDFDQAVREAIFVLNRNGFEPEMVQADVGYIRTRWSNKWYDNDKDERYRVRIIINFNPSRTQMIISAPAEFRSDGTTWKVGYDSKAIETLRTDLTQSIGN